MNVTIRKIGNSEGVILRKEVLERDNLRAGDTLNLLEDGTELRLRPPGRGSGRVRAEDEDRA